LLNLRLAKEQAATPTSAIVRASRAGEIPLSFGQERMWLLDQLKPGGPAYIRPIVLRFQGRLEISALEASLNEILRRHEILRTVYRSVGGRLVQLAIEAVPLQINVIDIGRLCQSSRNVEAERLAREEIGCPFDLSQGPLFRARLIRLAEDDHWLILTTHHIAFDGWSQGLLHEELAALYAAFRDGRSFPIPESSLRYADFALWQRQWSSSPEAHRQLAWWRQALQGAPTTLEMPADNPRPPVQSQRGAQLPVVVPRPLGDALQALARREQATSFMVLMAAWNLTQFAVGARPTNTRLFFSRWNKIPSPITWPL